MLPLISFPACNAEEEVVKPLEPVVDGQAVQGKLVLKVCLNASMPESAYRIPFFCFSCSIQPCYSALRVNFTLTRGERRPQSYGERKIPIRLHWQVALAGNEGTMLDVSDTTISTNVSTETPPTIASQVATVYAAAG